MKMRVANNTPAVLMTSDGKKLTCTILDLSVDGFRCRLAEPAPISDLVKLESGQTLHDIEVRWATGLELGGRLL